MIIIMSLERFNVWKVILFGFNLLMDFWIIIVVFVFIILVEIYVI